MSESVITLGTPVLYARGVGPVRAGLLRGLGIETCGDLLFYYPRSYLAYADEGTVAEMRVGEMATVRGVLVQTRLIKMKPRRFEALLDDGTGEGGKCVLTWFNMFGLEGKLEPGMMVRVTGKVTVFNGRKQLMQPAFEVLKGEGEEVAAKGAWLEPVYAASADLSSAAIGKVVGGVLDALVPQLEEWFPEDYLRERHFLTRRDAVMKIHRPGSLREAEKAKRTLAYHEFFLHQTAVGMKRYFQRHGSPAVGLRVDERVDARIRGLLPFEMTGAQDRVVASIRKDLHSAKPMNRLLQGDVGSGKTVVALYAMLAANATAMPKGRAEIENSKLIIEKEEGFVGYQAALMAPTEILAEQHFITVSRLLEGKRVEVALLTGSVMGKERESLLKRIAEGWVGIVIGTHALLSEAVRFKGLAVVVIDEQHKFGVEQRSVIRTKTSAVGGVAPHMLVMTATPIPRTLAMTAFGDLDVSVIDELPPGRVGIFTKMTPRTNREEVYRWMATRVKEGEQAYVVVPAIDESELELRTVAGTQEELQKEWLRECKVGLLHGRMARETRQAIMERFRQGLIDVLVATTVIEVGVDVPNATMMVVEHADRFGLSQLHQLRGRVGRGKKQSYCVLLGDQTTDDGIARLQAMVKYASGFKIAEEDLKIRGMGEIVGTSQSGRSDIHFAELLFDPVLLPLARKDAFNMVAADPRLLDAGHRELRGEVLGRFKEMITLADVG